MLALASESKKIYNEEKCSLRKEYNKMETEKMLDILEKIRIYIENNSLNIAKEFVKLEIENLKGITEQKMPK